MNELKEVKKSWITQNKKHIMYDIGIVPNKIYKLIKHKVGYTWKKQIHGQKLETNLVHIHTHLTEIGDGLWRKGCARDSEF